MAQTLMGQAISIGQRDYAVFKVLPTYGGRFILPNFNSTIGYRRIWLNDVKVRGWFGRRAAQG